MVKRVTSSYTNYKILGLCIQYYSLYPNCSRGFWFPNRQSFNRQRLVSQFSWRSTISPLGSHLLQLINQLTPWNLDPLKCSCSTLNCYLASEDWFINLLELIKSQCTRLFCSWNIGNSACFGVYHLSLLPMVGFSDQEYIIPVVWLRQW